MHFTFHYALQHSPPFTGCEPGSSIHSTFLSMLSPNSFSIEAITIHGFDAILTFVTSATRRANRPSHTYLSSSNTSNRAQRAYASLSLDGHFKRAKGLGPNQAHSSHGASHYSAHRTFLSTYTFDHASLPSTHHPYLVGQLRKA